MSFKVYIKNTGNIIPLDLMHDICDLKIGFFSIKERWERIFPEASIVCLNDDELIPSDGLVVEGSFVPLEKPQIGINILLNNRVVGKWGKPKGEKEYKGIYLNYLFEFIVYNKEVMEFDTSLKDLSEYKKYEKDVWIEENVDISKDTIFNTEKGPIFIKKNAIIRYNSIIEGPVQVGENSLVENGFIHSFTVLGNTNKISGEVEESIFMDFVNKHHYGFIGHSYVGEWVNFGAGTTNSDLKNNYSSVKLVLSNDITIDTNQLKIGCFIGDHVKTSIGTLINTGSVIGAFSNVFGFDILPKYIKPFSWGKNGVYDLEKLKGTIVKVMGRRGIEPDEKYINKIEESWLLWR